MRRMKISCGPYYASECLLVCEVIYVVVLYTAVNHCSFRVLVLWITVTASVFDLQTQETSVS